MSIWMTPVIAVVGLTTAWARLRLNKRHHHVWTKWNRVEEHYPSGRQKTRQIRRCETCGLAKVRDL